MASVRVAGRCLAAVEKRIELLIPDFGERNIKERCDPGAIEGILNKSCASFIDAHKSSMHESTAGELQHLSSPSGLTCRVWAVVGLKRSGVSDPPKGTDHHDKSMLPAENLLHRLCVLVLSLPDCQKEECLVQPQARCSQSLMLAIDTPCCRGVQSASVRHSRAELAGMLGHIIDRSLDQWRGQI